MINSVLESEKLFVGERFSDGGKVRKKKAELFNLSRKTDQTSRFYRTPRIEREIL